MALLTDYDVLGLEELELYEGSITNVTTTHGIDVDSKIQASIASVSDQLLLRLLKAGLSDPQHLHRRVLGMSTVVVTSPLERWLSMDILASIFAEAYNVQLNDRFKGKWVQYVAQADLAQQVSWQYGVGIVFNPLPKAAIPLVSTLSGTLPTQEIVVSVAWVDANANEGALSDSNGVILPDGTSINVATAEGVLNAPAAAAGWNVYVGQAGLDLTRQNNAPIPVGAAWSLPDSGVLQGPSPQDGQTPDYYVIDPRRMPRG
jgi:hypothetical protein